MEWPKIKTILILILATVNLFLLSLVANRGWQSAKNYETSITQSISIMAQNGVALSRGTIPNVDTIPTGVVERDPWLEWESIRVLLGENVTASGDGITYHSEKGLARFYANGEFYAKLSPNVYPVVDSSVAEFALTLLNEMGIEGDVVAVAPDQSWVTACQTVEGVPVFSCEISLIFEDGFFVEISAGSRRLTGETQFVAVDEQFSAPMSLLHWLDFVQLNVQPCEEITEIELGYVLETRGGVTELAPTWKIVTDWTTYMVSARTGNVTFAS